MTLRDRTRLIVIVLLAVSLLVITLNVLASRYRKSSLDQFSSALEANTTLLELEACIVDLQRQMALLGTTISPANPSVIQHELKMSLLQGLDRCELEHLQLPDHSEEFTQVRNSVSMLLQDWRVVVDEFESDHVRAIVRQATSAQPLAQMLLNNLLPHVKENQFNAVSQAHREFLETSRRADQSLLACMFIAALIFGGTILSLLGRLSSSVSALTAGAAAFARGDLDHRLVIEGSDEFSAIGVEMNRMAENVQRTRALLETHANDLENNLQTLQQTQADLVRKERMAALGGLVAGVAHEVNTPLGVAFTAGTFCHDLFTTFQDEVRTGPVTPDRLSEALQDGEDALGLMINNLSKAVHLIQAFKQIAVDRGQSDNRRVQFSIWLDQIMISLSPLARREGVSTSLDIAQDGHAIIAAGELEQVLTNMIVNALVHAFPEGARGPHATPPEILIHCDINPVELLLRVQDNGRGMSEEVIARVFEPFFTTRRSDGGSGLGMHIAHQIIQDRFEGTIQVESDPDTGTIWSLRLPYPTSALQIISVAAA